MAAGTLQHCLAANSGAPSVCSSLEHQVGFSPGCVPLQCVYWQRWPEALCVAGAKPLKPRHVADTLASCAPAQVVHCYSEVVCPQQAADHLRCFQ